MSRPGRRLPIVVVLAGLLVAAVSTGERHVRAEAAARQPTVAASMPAAGTRSSAWYCPGGPVGSGANTDQVTMSNTSAHPVRVAIDVMVPDTATAERFATIAARGSTTLAVARLSRVKAAAVVVQPLGDGVVVEQGYTVSGDVAMSPCATRAASNWYFAGGASVGGAQTWVSLFNPFAVDAVVDVEAYSEDGLLAPGTLQGLVVGHGSRLALRVDRLVSEEHIVAMGVHARAGSQIVASESVIQTRTPTLRSASMSLGALAPASTWLFADNRSSTGESQQLVIANPGGDDATARVSIVTDVDTVIVPRVVRVPATSAVSVDFSGLVPAGLTYTLSVHSEVPIVAETRDVGAGGFAGLVTEVGSTAPAPGWVFAGGPFTATGLGGDKPRVPAGFDLAVIMKVDATPAEINTMHALLPNNGHVSKVQTITRDAAYTAFATQARGNPALLREVTKADLPITFAVAVESSQWIAPLRTYLASKAGVDTVLTVAAEGPVVADDIVVFNPGTRNAVVSLAPSAGGATLSGRALTNVGVAPGRHVTISLLGLSRQGAAVVVHATDLVVAERFTAGPSGATRSPGVPSWQPA